jgi:hypothetical protein
LRFGLCAHGTSRKIRGEFFASGTKIGRARLKAFARSARYADCGALCAPKRRNRRGEQTIAAIAASDLSRRKGCAFMADLT